MAIINNLNTRQNPITTGSSGTQVVKFIDAPRVYIKAADASAAPVTAKSNGVVPSGWTDLGIVEGKVKIAYTKELKEIRTGIDQVLRATYAGKKTAQFDFDLAQFDDAVMSAISGLTPSQIQSGSIYQFAVGSEDVITKALLLVVQNKLDGKEWQFYNPGAFMSFNIADSGDQTIIKGTGSLPSFSWGGGTNEAIFVQSIFA